MNRPRQLPLDLKSIPAFGRDDFFVGRCNELAVHWVEGWPRLWYPFPAFILFGEIGSGKSHLAEVWRRNANAVLISSDDFIAMSDDAVIALSENIVLDGLERLVGNKAQEEKLFHLYNHFMQIGRFFVGLSRVAPESMDFAIKDLSSRLRAVPHAEMAPPDDDLLLKVLAKRFHDQGFVVAENALSYAVMRMERSWEATDKLVRDAIQKATAEKRQMTLPLFRTILGDEEN